MYTLIKKVQKLSLEQYIFKRYTLIPYLHPKNCILVPTRYMLVPRVYIIVHKWCILLATIQRQLYFISTAFA